MHPEHLSSDKWIIQMTFDQIINNKMLHSHLRNTFSLIALLLILCSCSKEQVPVTEKPVRFAATMVVGALSERENNLYSGEVHARHETVLSFRVSGKFIERKVEVGNQVAAGQLLARLDPADNALQQTAAEAQYLLAEAELKRFKELHEKNFVSQSALDAKETALKAAVAQTGLARNQAAYTSLRSDHGGVVYAVLAEVGQDVSVGQPILRLAQDGEREVSIAIPESRIAEIKVGMPAQIELGGKTIIGRVREITPAADAASRTFPARVSFDAGKVNSELGMTARVRINESVKSNGTSTSAFRIPLTAIYQQGDKAAVWIVGADNSVSLRPVVVTAYRENGALISSGLSAGERIVSAGVHKLTQGDKIKIADNGNAK
jgi:RND family efflux transporter MFP subunit